MNVSSDSTFLKFGVPQGSVLDPVLFTLYTIPLCEICRRHAEDTQLFCTFSVGNDVELEEARRRIQNCISEIKMWMSFHFLKPNDDKTEVILITPRSNHNKKSLPTIQVGNSDVTPSESARNIRVMFDANMSMQPRSLPCVDLHGTSLGTLGSQAFSHDRGNHSPRLCSGVLANRLWEHLALWGARLLVAEASTSSDFRCKAGDKMSTIGSHYTRPPRTASAGGQAVNSVQTACYHLQGPTWECTILPERDFTAIAIYTHTAL